MLRIHVLFSFTLLTSGLLAQDSPVGGWHGPLWASEYEGGDLTTLLDVGDVTGDGFRDFVEWRSGMCRVIHGRGGMTWHAIDPSRMGQKFHAVQANLDGDSIADLLLVQDFFSDTLFSPPFVGLVQAVKGGARPAVLWESFTTDTLVWPGSIVTFDANLDGIDDVVMPSDRVWRECVSGADGSRIWRRRAWAGTRTFPIPDLDGDGVDELYVDEGSLDVLISGADGSALWLGRRAFESSSELGTVLTAEVNADGIPDLIVAEVDTIDQRGRLVAIDGKTGLTIWHRRGKSFDARVGGGLELADQTGDGRPELRSLREGAVEYAEVRDLTTGMLLWAQEWDWAGSVTGSTAGPRWVDVDGDGLEELVSSSDSLSAGQPHLSQVHAWSGWTGLPLWDFGQIFPEGRIVMGLVLHDVDGDRVLDFVMSTSHPRGASRGRSWIGVWNGLDGRPLWIREEYLAAGDGGALLVHEEAPGRPTVVLARESGEVVLFDALEGNLLERRQLFHGRPHDGFLPLLELVDWNRDGQPEVLARPVLTSGQGRSAAALFDPTPGGEIIWASDLIRFGVDSTEGVGWFSAVDDFDGDGWLDPVVAGFADRVPERGRLFALSGRLGTWHEGLQVEGAPLANAQGGSLRFQADAGEVGALLNYQLLMSENGVGETRFGSVTLPLAPGLWLSRTAAGFYPPAVRERALGTLDEEGRTRIGFTIPPQALTAFVGRELAFALTTWDLRGEPTWSSAAAVVEIQP